MIDKSENTQQPIPSKDSPSASEPARSAPSPELAQPSILVGQQQLPPHVLAQILAQSQMRPMGGVQLTLPGIVQQAQHWQGPYPPPEAVERYEQVLPGTLNRLITMAEQLQTAQITQSNMALEHTKNDTRRGHWLGFITTGLAMLGAIGCAALSQPYVACLFLSVPVMAVAKALIETTKTATSVDIIKAASELPKSEVRNSNESGKKPV